MSSISRSEAESASDEELIALSKERIATHLRCSCSKHKKGRVDVPIRFFVEGIRKKAQKKGIVTLCNMYKTCDAVHKQNEMMNPTNNPCYAAVRRALDDAARLEAFGKRDKGIKALGIIPAPRILKEPRLEMLDEDPTSLPESAELIITPALRKRVRRLVLLTTSSVSDDVFGLFEPSAPVIAVTKISQAMLDDLAPLFERPHVAPGIDDEHTSWRYY
jgi:hypothetical protein